MNDPLYYEYNNHTLLSALPKIAATVVEVGCASGVLAKAYRTINPNARYIGIELSESAAQTAATRMDVVIIGNVEEPETLDELDDVLEDSSVDVLIFGDVLEHLIDPWSVLSQFKPFMSENGYCIACVPNVSHWTIVLDLIHSEWNYREKGILDKTHLRFFTKKTMIDLFQNAGWHIESLIPIIETLDETELVINIFTSMAHHFKLTPEQIRENLNVYQWVIRARCI